LIRATAADRQYGRADAYAAKDVDMMASGGVSWSAVERALLRVGMDGDQIDAEFSVGGLFPRRSIGRRHQRERCV
jgi:hypothetical protein